MKKFCLIISILIITSCAEEKNIERYGCVWGDGSSFILSINYTDEEMCKDDYCIGDKFYWSNRDGKSPENDWVGVNRYIEMTGGVVKWEFYKNSSGNINQFNDWSPNFMKIYPEYNCALTLPDGVI